MCERGPGPFDLPCEFKDGQNIFGRWKWNEQERFFGSGPIFADNEWEAQYPYRTWEINWPLKRIFEWPKELVGWMWFESLDADEWFNTHRFEGCDIH